MEMKKKLKIFGWIVAIVLLVFGIKLAWPEAKKATSPVQLTAGNLPLNEDGVYCGTRKMTIGTQWSEEIMCMAEGYRLHTKVVKPGPFRMLAMHDGDPSRKYEVFPRNAFTNIVVNGPKSYTTQYRIEPLDGSTDCPKEVLILYQIRKDTGPVIKTNALCIVMDPEEREQLR
jgi:hypothetical protein